MLKSLDHIIIAVKDLSKSTEFYSNLFGFPSTWEGSHAGLGTKNVLFVFENMSELNTSMSLLFTLGNI